MKNEFAKKILPVSNYDKILWLMLLIKQDVDNLTEDNEMYEKTLDLRRNLKELSDYINLVTYYGEDFYRDLGVNQELNFFEKPEDNIDFNNIDDDIDDLGFFDDDDDDNDDDDYN